VYWTKPVVGASGSDADTSGHTAQHSRKRKAVLDPNWSIPSEPDTEELVSFASNLLCLGIGEGLLSLVNDAETRARETVHQAEEELEGLEEEYQACARKREEKENILNDARAELEALISEVEHHTQRLSQLAGEEENAKNVTLSHPDTVGQLKEKLECVLNIFTPSPTCDKPMPMSEDKPMPMSEDKPLSEEDNMDTTQ
jgi:hypothetical protein